MSYLLRLFVLVVVLTLPGAAWAQGVGSFVSPGPLSRDHAELDTITGCTNCHAPGRGPTPERCMVCHDPVRQQVATRTGFHKDKGTTCGDCHPEHRGREFQLIQFDDAGFDHLAETGFPLEGAHAREKCVACHTTVGTYTGLSQECSSCHQDPHNGAASKRDILGDCENCHDADDWKVDSIPTTTFDHTRRESADYLLDGQHTEVDCVDCHFKMKFLPIEHANCLSCHANPHRGEFKDETCESCHPNASTWEVEKFDHDRTRYPLRGLHRRVGCDECHDGDKTTPIAFQRCESCHPDVHGGQFRPRGCDDCHTVDVAKFALRDFDHDKTEFPLIGRHREQTCEECHKDGSRGIYANLAHADCDDCHEDAHSGRFQPTDCQMCHTPDGFEVQAFDHDRTSFPHTGKHVGLDCNKCHRDFQWNGIPHESCVDCHYTKNPHRPVITPEQCDDCHQTTGFELIAFDHAANTEFDLAPAHDEMKCTGCHTYIYHFAGLDQSCTACHIDDRPWGHYEGECEGCHEAEHWFPGGLGGRDHDVTGFGLAGTHSLLPCESCHPTGRPRGEAVPACVSCHSADDPHMNLLGTACADCHVEMSWFRTTFRHSTTGWPLRGAHRLAACVDCHAVSYVGTSTDCYRCHETAAPLTIPAHLTPAFQTCDYCHRPYTWAAPAYPH